MISVNQAVATASHQLQILYGEVSNVRLEEVFQSDDESSWCVTLSFLAPIAKEEPEPQSIAPVVPLRSRYYKTFEIDGQTGEFRSMKIRPVPSV